ncbi:hypothetical protein MUK42_14275 [Musa troglodytarum]|uniref:Uncharacterized protein n=1 Tax=Musa troglodytarum TaxID=320322 RepID=A0A9E7KZN8_9LILI|nr:hypothetical protein MUK42_14275 [Musa troglodytarum]
MNKCDLISIRDKHMILIKVGAEQEMASRLTRDRHASAIHISLFASMTGFMLAPLFRSLLRRHARTEENGCSCTGCIGLTAPFRAMTTPGFVRSQTVALCIGPRATGHRLLCQETYPLLLLPLSVPSEDTLLNVRREGDKAQIYIVASEGKRQIRVAVRGPQQRCRVQGMCVHVPLLFEDATCVIDCRGILAILKDRNQKWSTYHWDFIACVAGCYVQAPVGCARFVFLYPSKPHQRQVILFFSLVLSLALALALALDSLASAEWYSTFLAGLAAPFLALLFFASLPAAAVTVEDLFLELEIVDDLLFGLWLLQALSSAEERVPSSSMAALDMVSSHRTVLLALSKPSASCSRKKLRATSMDSLILRSLGPFAVTILLCLHFLRALLRPQPSSPSCLPTDVAESPRGRLGRVVDAFATPISEAKKRS